MSSGRPGTAARVGIAVGAAALLGLIGCRGSLSPLSNKLKIGEESYIVFAADGEDGKGDLFASPSQGGKSFQLTFTRVDERAPALSPDGAILAFLRSRTAKDTGGVSLVVFNLVNGAERRTTVPADAYALTWSGDGASLLVRTPSGVLATAVPPRPLALAPVTAPDRPRADSLFRVILGDPPIGEAIACASGIGVCARLANGDSLTLSEQGSSPLRWGPDSVAFLEGGAFMIRPLAGGRIRTVQWTEQARNPRGLTYFPGVKR